MRRKGFTLVELLVVVAIIVILAGILYPVFAATRRAAYKATCLSNLKQVGLAVQMYAQDYDENFPTACCQTDVALGKAQPNLPTQTPYLWTLAAPYIKNPQLWRCPADTGFTLFGGRIKFSPSAFAQTGSSYNYNTDLAWEHTGDPAQDPFETIGRWAPFNLSTVPYPAYTFLAGEPAGHWHNSISGNNVTYQHSVVMVGGNARSYTRKQMERLAEVRNPLWNPKEYGWE
jgi:prepilin-type N-terminal cleavage/methylation domain-containing protein